MSSFWADGTKNWASHSSFWKYSCFWLLTVRVICDFVVYHFSLGFLFPALSSYMVGSLFESILVDRQRNHCLPCVLLSFQMFFRCSAQAFGLFTILNLCQK